MGFLRHNAAGCLVLLVLASGGLITVRWMGQRYGWPYYVLGLPLGITIMLGILGAATLAWTLLQGFLFHGLPELPVCRRGCCRGGRLGDPGNYTLVWNEGWTLRGYRSRCGTTYKKIGPRFVELAEDGSIHPYLVWNWRKGWIPDRPPGD